MAKKNDFAGVNTGRVYEAINLGTSKKGQQGTASPQEAYERGQALKTQGRKGCKLGRINMAFTPENHSFLKLMAKANGMTMTEFTNIVVTAYRREHPELVEQGKQFLKTVRDTFTEETKEVYATITELWDEQASKGMSDFIFNSEDVKKQISYESMSKKDILAEIEKLRSAVVTMEESEAEEVTPKEEGKADAKESK